jgi:hypothetical protein
MEDMAATRKYPDAVRERAIRLVRDDRDRERGGAPLRRSRPSTCEVPEGANALQAVALPSGWERTEEVRRRVLIAQLERLAERVVDTDPVSLDAAARRVRLASRLKHNELAW